jgi:hypothetical protein
MIACIVVELVAICTVVAIYSVLKTAETKKWNDRKVILFEIGIFAVGSGLVQLLTGRNPASEFLAGLITLYRQHHWVILALMSFWPMAWLVADILSMISARYRQ